MRKEAAADCVTDRSKQGMRDVRARAFSLLLSGFDPSEWRKPKPRKAFRLVVFGLV